MERLVCKENRIEVDTQKELEIAEKIKYSVFSLLGYFQNVTTHTASTNKNIADNITNLNYLSNLIYGELSNSYPYFFDNLDLKSNSTKIYIRNIIHHLLRDVQVNEDLIHEYKKNRRKQDDTIPAKCPLRG